MAASRTVRDLVTRALRVATVVGAGETPDANDSSDALLSLNLMLDAWQAEELYSYAIVERTHPLTAGVGTYTIGTSGAINVARPVRIEYAFTRDAQNYDRGMEIIPETVYAQIVLKSLGNTFPTALYYQPAYPLGTIFLYPLPPASVTLYLGCWTVMSEFPSLNDTVILPPGYEDAIVYSLVEQICPEYGKAVSLVVATNAQRLRANIQQNNLQDVRISCEFTGSKSRSTTYWDIRAGNY